jgi:hypothetical protein
MVNIFVDIIAFILGIVNTKIEIFKLDTGGSCL